jgi:putative membrane protein
MHTLLHLAVLALAIFLMARLMPGLVRVRSAGAAVAVAVVFSVLNFFLGWFIRALLFVPGLLTFGLLFLFVPFIVNWVLLWVTDRLMGSFEIRGVRGLLASAAIITVVNWLFAMHTEWSHFAMHGAPQWV